MYFIKLYIIFFPTSVVVRCAALIAYTPKARVCLHYRARVHEVVYILNFVRQKMQILRGRNRLFGAARLQLQRSSGTGEHDLCHALRGVWVRQGSRVFLWGAKETPRRQAQVRRVYSNWRQRQRRTGSCWRSAPLFGTPGRGESNARSRAHDHHA